MSIKNKLVDLGDNILVCRGIRLGSTKAGQLGDTTSALVAGRILTATNVGTVGASTVTAIEHGDNIDHLTALTLTSFAVGTSGDNANLALGAKIYTWPTGVDVAVEYAILKGGLTAAISVTTDTPEVGLGTVVATGAAATLTTATWENIMDGGATRLPTTGGDQVAIAPDVAGTTFRKMSLSTISPIIATSGGAARDVFLNVADGWADVAAAGAVTFTGTILLKWTVIT